MVKKKDGTYRFVLTLGSEKKITEVDPEPMLMAEDLFRRLGGI